MGTKFEEWLEENYPKGPILRIYSRYDPFSLTNKEQIEHFMQKAYEAGWNACRDKWGGLEYDDPANETYKIAEKDD